MAHELFGAMNLKFSVNHFLNNFFLNHKSLNIKALKNPLKLAFEYFKKPNVYLIEIYEKTEHSYLN